ncbi:MAG TPA: amidohydrolase family protein, partial [Terriglobia bacterium]|nr:amidohydrolase family protein [Terriglobia bacterium]
FLAIHPCRLGFADRMHGPSGEEAHLMRGADLVLLNGKIWTGEPAAGPGVKAPPAKFAQAVAILDGRIVAVGTNDEIKPYVSSNTQVVDLGGRLAVPGFIDDHTHFLGGSFQLLEVNLKNTRDEAEFTRLIAQKAATIPKGRWLLGGNWDEEAWPDAKLPTRWMIDSVTPDHPAYLSRYDGHAGLANSAALKLAGVTKDTPEPPGGEIVRDPQTGEPTGVLKDAAQDLVGKVIPNPSEEEVEEALRAGLKEAARVGLTTVNDMALGDETPNGDFTGEIRLLRRAEQEGWLTCRFYEITPIDQWKKLADAGISHNMGDDYIKMGAVKGFADGSIGSRTAWMFKAYSDDDKNFGLPTPLMDPSTKMEDLVRGASAAGIQPAIHAIGTRANAEMLAIFAKVEAEQGAGHRFRIEHAQHVRQQDYAAFGKLGIVASMQPYHAIDDGRWVEKRIGHERARWSYAWRSMLDAGAMLAFGTDWPVAPLDPLLGVYAAVTRATLDGRNPGGWFPEEKLTLDEALRAYTYGSAYASFQEKEKGTIAPGKLGDIVVLSDDLFSIPPDKIKDAHVVLTVVGGRIVYRVM